MQTISTPIDVKNMAAPTLEQSIIACLLLDGDLFDKYKHLLDPEAFQTYKYRLIVEAMHQLREQDLPVDYVMVTTQNPLIQVTDMTDLVGNLPPDIWLDVKAHGEHLPDYLRVLNQLKIKRDIANQLQMGKEMEEVLANVEKLNATGMDKFFNPREIALEIVAALEARMKGDRGIPYPFPMLNKATNGIQPGQLIIVAARPSVGKTTFLGNIAINAGLKGKRIFFGSAEMSAEQVGLRLMSQLIKNNLFAPQVTVDPVEVVKKFEATNISIHQFTTMNELEMKLKDVVSETDIVMLDYLQLIEPRGKYRSMYERATNIINELVQLRNKYNLPLLVASQYSRVADRNQPTLADLRDSGAIEQAADIVISLWNHPEDEVTPDKKKIRIDLLKNRNGYTFNNSKKNNYALWLNRKMFEFYEEEDRPPF